MRLLRHRRLVAATSGGGSAFSPASIAGLKLWLDASQITGLNDGDAVTTWADLSGNGYDATQATGSKKPTYSANALNGKPVVQFDGVDDVLLNATFTHAQSVSAGTLFVVRRVSNPALAAWLIDLSNSQLSDFQNVNLGVAYVGGAYGYSARSTTAATVTSIIYDGSLSGDDNRLKLRFDGVAKNPLTFGGVIPATTSAGTVGFGVGARMTGAQFLLGYVAESLFYNRALTTLEMAQVEAYLRAKWGTP
jgi:hypothetical protein